MSRVLYHCPFIPAEWIAAHGFMPSRLFPSASGLSQVGACPFALSFARAAQAPAAAVIFTTTCDQMRRAAESSASQSNIPVFLLHVPRTWDTAAALRLYQNEITRLGHFLQVLGGKPPTPSHLAATMEFYQAQRRRLESSRRRLSARQFYDSIREFQNNPTQLPSSQPGALPSAGIPLVLVGSPLLAEHQRIYEEIENAGGRIVLDATSGGERSLVPAFDPLGLRRDPFRTLTETYFQRLPDVFRCPNHQFYGWLGAGMAERQAQAIILWYYVWCDTWHAEVQRLKEWAGLPLLTLEATNEPHLPASCLSRIQAFFEMLNCTRLTNA